MGSAFRIRLVRSGRPAFKTGPSAGRDPDPNSPFFGLPYFILLGRVIPCRSPLRERRFRMGKTRNRRH